MTTRIALVCVTILIAEAAGSPLVKSEVVSPGAGCTTCQANELAVVDVETVGHGKYTYTSSPTCQQGAPDDVGKIMSGIAKAAFSKDYAGALKDLASTQEFRDASGVVHGEVGKIINGGRSDTANCQLLCNIVPHDAIVTDYSIYAGETNGKMVKCDAGKDCGIGYSKFADIPADKKTDSSQWECVNFMNWSGDRDRVARLVTFFKPPANWKRGRQF